MQIYEVCMKPMRFFQYIYKDIKRYYTLNYTDHKIKRIFRGVSPFFFFFVTGQK